MLIIKIILFYSGYWSGIYQMPLQVILWGGLCHPCRIGIAAYAEQQKVQERRVPLMINLDKNFQT
jgi:hypothetical protein